MSLTHDDVRKILEILEQADCEEVRLEFGDLKIHLRRRGSPADARHEERSTHDGGAARPGGPEAQVAAPEAADRCETSGESSASDGVVAVTAPMLGTFYRAPSPEAAPFVEPGRRVSAEDTVCLVEVMKLFSSVKAGVAGVVERILAENGALVEYGQPLILIRKESP